MHAYVLVIRCKKGKSFGSLIGMNGQNFDWWEGVPPRSLETAPFAVIGPKGKWHWVGIAEGSFGKWAKTAKKRFFPSTRHGYYSMEAIRCHF